MIDRGAALLLGLTIGLLPAARATASVEPAVNIAALSLDELIEQPLEAEPPAVEEPAEDETVEEKIIEDYTEEVIEGEGTRGEGGYLRSPSTCPSDIETLTAALIRDIPNYTNRVLQRTVAVIPDNNTDRLTDNNLLKKPYRPSFVLIAGRPELEPLDLSQYTFTTNPEAGGPLTQIFFTTLSRQYSGLKVNEVQEYHWLFLAQVPDGWWLAFMFSAIDDADTARAPLPPREDSEGSVGQAVQLWLRDCRAGATNRLE